MQSDYPTSFPSANNHRLVLLSPDQRRPDFERLQDIGADAVAALREAMAHTNMLNHRAGEVIGQHRDLLLRRLERRDAVSEGARAEMNACLSHAELIEDDQHAASLAECLRNALKLSDRVADLLAAEREIGRLRGGSL